MSESEKMCAEEKGNSNVLLKVDVKITKYGKNYLSVLIGSSKHHTGKH